MKIIQMKKVIQMQKARRTVSITQAQMKSKFDYPQQQLRIILIAKQVFVDKNVKNIIEKPKRLTFFQKLLTFDAFSTFLATNNTYYTRCCYLLKINSN